ncbi:MAG TPA: deoxyribose-phosphate aldolase [Spirochaetia bacterium]|nr:deoxyribose-phosphate aldolase [Spirochaetales bacterium]HRS65250.1 deoxyribose-phosphate aldolase [Spirochaetia bacterium]HPD79838.1 deoxyribose-phosphate aldolase [Spirochaetales bacterium]HQG39807.1 deoxyribose-phosphate aldolase [Spirochaetales bacterium]HQK33381.1 deoxyribose-phosphate aldolase [Spirochaetales bacterium]
MEWSKASLARTIDHTVLKAIATEQQIKELCAEAKTYNFASVCVNPCWVPLCAKELASTKVMVCTVIGFPLGANATEIKAAEAKLAVEQGAHEVDMVINIGAAKSGDWKTVEYDIREVIRAAGKATVKVIIETCYLTDDEKVKACEAAKRAGAHFVKTSTGFGTGGATVEDVRLMKKTVGDALKVKASGGIRTYHDAIKMLEAGADRIGASSSVSIISELPE